MLNAAGRVWRVCLGWGETLPVDQAAFPEGSDMVSEEVPLEVSPMMWDPCGGGHGSGGGMGVGCVSAVVGEGLANCIGICYSVVSLVLSPTT